MDDAGPSLFLVTTPGLEHFAAAECTALGLAARVVVGGVEVHPADARPGALPWGALTRLNLHSRTATRVLLPVGAFRASRFGELTRRVRVLGWSALLPPEAGVVVRVTSRKSRLWHGDAVAEAVAEGVGRPLAASDPAAQLLVVTIDRDVVRISADSSGAALHRRGHRLATAKAPLRETIAAAMVLASGWDGSAGFVDPFCGSGTLPIEAALLARRIAPGLSRAFAFERWPGHDADAWAEACAAARAAQRPSLPAGPGSVTGSDRDAGAIVAAQANAERAGVAEDVVFVRRSVSELANPTAGGPPGVVVTNPPHGRRIRGGPDPTALYGRFGRVVRERLPGWRVVVLTSSVRFETALRLPVDDVLRVASGGRPLRLVRARAMERRGAACPDGG